MIGPLVGTAVFAIWGWVIVFLMVRQNFRLQRKADRIYELDRDYQRATRISLQRAVDRDRAIQELDRASHERAVLDESLAEIEQILEKTYITLGRLRDEGNDEKASNN